MSHRRRLLALLGIMAGVAMAVAALSVWVLYQAAFAEQRDQLAHLARSQARMIESLAEHFAGMGMTPAKVKDATIAQVADAIREIQGFGRTGDFLLGRRDGGMIVFLLNHPRDRGSPKSVPFESALAEPMRRALKGQSGTMTGPDYVGVEVLAAYQPVESLGLGIVAKIDTAELRQPFLRAGTITGGSAFLVILLGTLLFRRISTPLVENLERAVGRLTEAQQVAKLGNWDRNLETGESWWSDETYRIFGLEPEATGPAFEAFLERIHPDDREMVQEAIERCMQRREPYSIEYRIVRPDGSTWFIYAHGTWHPEEAGRPVHISGTVQDVTERRQVEDNVRRLATAIEGLSENFALYDADDRLIMCNKGSRDINEPVAETMKPGVPFEEHLRALVEKGLIKQAVGREGEWIQERLEWHRNPGPSFEVTRQDGRWFLVREQPMADGATVTIATDITERKRAEEALRESEEAHRNLVEGSVQGIFIHDSLKPIFVNDALARMFGYDSPEEVTALGSLDRLYAPEERARLKGYQEARLRGEDAPETYEFKGLRKDGSEIWLQRSSRVIAWRGRPAIQGTVVDITERKRSEDELERQKTLFEAVFRDVPDAMLLADTERNILMCNPAVTRTFGYEDDEILGCKTEILYESPEEFERQGRIRFNLSAEEKLEPYVVNYRRKSGEVFPGETVGTATRDRDGNTIGFVGVIRDITDRLRAEETLHRALVKAEEANQTKSVFLASMSHELRTPLNSIIGFSETLMTQMFGPLGNPRYKEYAEDINFSGIHLLEVISDILDISKIEAGEAVVAEEDMDVPQLVEAGVKMLRGRADQQGIILSRVFPDDCPRLRADPRHIKQIVLNLVSNAVKFTPPGGKVELEVSLDDQRAFTFTIKDNGVGIHAENLAKVFEPFGQVGDVYSRSYEGTGLGLPLAKSLIELHGGNLDLASEPGKGTTVTIRFPPERTVPAPVPAAVGER